MSEIEQRKTLTFKTMTAVATDGPDGVTVDVGRCRDCKHWGATKYLSQTAHERRVCERLEDNVDQDSGGGPPGSLAVAGDFGCVLFELKEAT